MAEGSTPIPGWQRVTPPQDGRGWHPPPYGQQVGGMHPTGMLSCLTIIVVVFTTY